MNQNKSPEHNPPSPVKKTKTKDLAAKTEKGNNFFEDLEVS